jgi:hypothetical protein
MKPFLKHFYKMENHLQNRSKVETCTILIDEWPFMSGFVV